MTALNSPVHMIEQDIDSSIDQSTKVQRLEIIAVKWNWKLRRDKQYVGGTEGTTYLGFGQR